jgi:hypothetical protein
MRTRNTRIRRGARPRRGRPARTRGRTVVRRRSAPRRARAMARRQPFRRRGRYGGRARASVLRFGSPLTAAIVAGLIVLALAGYLVARHANHPVPLGYADPVAAQLVYTVPTANAAAITLPDAVQSELLQIGLAHRSIALTRVDSAGNASTSLIDMTPRTGNSPTDPVLLVAGRAVAVIETKISAIENAINSPAANRGGGQALYVGLTRATFADAPITIVSTGIDLANPDNFRSLRWSVPPEELVADVKNAGALPALRGHVTFVVVPTAGPQPQLGQAQKNYRNAVWKALLTAAGATSVTFIDANGITPSPGAPSAPTVAVPGLPGTPIPPVHMGNNTVRCTLPASYFVFNTATLTDSAQTQQDLTACISAALAAHARFALDGWASYQGPLNASGKPAFDYGYNVRLSRARVQTIAKLLVNDLGVPWSAITRLTWHGNLDQPDPGDPGSASNQVVIISYTTK